MSAIAYHTYVIVVEQFRYCISLSVEMIERGQHDDKNNQLLESYFTKVTNHVSLLSFDWASDSTFPLLALHRK